MAKIYKTNGEVLDIEPKNGKDFSLKELQAVVNGYIEIAEMKGGEIMVINEEGKLERLPFNEKATELYQKKVYAGDYIVGDVLVCNKNQVK